MISKKKVTALALAGLFVTPVLADTTIYKNNIQSSDGYLTAGDKLFSQALENSRNRTDSSKDAVKLSMWGKHNDSDKDGLTELKLSDKTYDNVNYILFADNSRQDNAIHRSSFSLDKTNLTLSRGILFRNASNSIETNQAGPTIKTRSRRTFKTGPNSLSTTRAPSPVTSSINSTRRLRGL